MSLDKKGIKYTEEQALRGCRDCHPQSFMVGNSSTQKGSWREKKEKWGNEQEDYVLGGIIIIQDTDGKSFSLQWYKQPAVASMP